MRRLLLAAVFGVLLLSVGAGCGGSSDTKSNVVTTPLPPERTNPK